VKLQTTDVAKVILKPGRERPVRQYHPWIFSGAVATIDNYQQPGQLADVYSTQNEFLARGYVNEHSQIICRLLTFKPVPIDTDFFAARMDQAIQSRQQELNDFANAFRIINSEGDFLPGLVVDRYDRGLVCQFLTAGMEQQRATILAILQEKLCPGFIYERSDVSARQEEGLPMVNRLLAGSLPEELIIREHDLCFKIDVAGGQKTGFFLDQRDNRQLLLAYATDRKVCDCFSYSGGFALQAARGGARSVTVVEQSKLALELVQENFRLNQLTAVPLVTVAADVFQFLRTTDQNFDVIILDPPSLARNRGSVQKAARGYKDLHLYAFKHLAPQGLLFTFACSQLIDHKLFQQIVFSAASNAGRDIQLLRRLSHSSDHPVSIFHPEGDYLKGMLLRVVC